MKNKANLPIYYFKADKYRKTRGGKTELIDIYCDSCSNLLLVYQKDYPRGILKRCYIDRIFYPHKYASLQYNKNINGPKKLPLLKCSKCGARVGKPVRYVKHGENRLAYELISGTWRRSKSKYAKGKNNISKCN